jgi:putative transposase
MAMPQDPNQRWSLDFASDALTRRRFRILVMVDDFTRPCLTLVADTSVGGLRVARELDAIIAVWGQPVACVFDNSTAMQRRSQDRGIDCATSNRENHDRTPSQNPSSDGRATSA